MLMAAHIMTVKSIRTFLPPDDTWPPIVLLSLTIKPDSNQAFRSDYQFTVTAEERERCKITINASSQIQIVEISTS